MKKQGCQHWIVRCSCGIAVRHCGCVATDKLILEEANICAFCRHNLPSLPEEPDVETPVDEIRDL